MSARDRQMRVAGLAFAMACGVVLGDMSDAAAQGKPDREQMLKLSADAKAAFQRGDLKAAAALYERAFEADPSEIILLKNKMIVLYRLEREQKTCPQAFDAASRFLTLSKRNKVELSERDRRDTMKVAYECKFRHAQTLSDAETIASLEEGRRELETARTYAATNDERRSIKLLDDRFVERISDLKVKAQLKAKGDRKQADPKIIVVGPQPSTTSGRAVAGWVLLGVGAAAAVGGGAIQGMRYAEASSFQDDCSGATVPGSCYDDEPTIQKYHDQQAVVWGITGLGVALAATGAILLITGGEEAPPAKPAPGAKAGPEPISLSPVVGPGLAGVQAGWRF